jgi:hypothetical protein
MEVEVVGSNDTRSNGQLPKSNLPNSQVAIKANQNIK